MCIVCAHVCVCVYARACVRWGQGWYQVCFSSTIHLDFGDSVSRWTESANSPRTAGQWAPRVHLLAPKCWTFRCEPLLLALDMRAGDLTSGPHASAESTLMTESSLSSPYEYTFIVNIYSLSAQHTLLCVRWGLAIVPWVAGYWWHWMSPGGNKGRLLPRKASPFSIIWSWELICVL